MVHIEFIHLFVKKYFMGSNCLGKSLSFQFQTTPFFNKIYNIEFQYWDVY
jgi:hypothetical protein